MPSIRTKRAGDAYFDLVREFPLRRLRTDIEHQEALAVFQKLARRSSDNTDVLEYVEVLVRLIAEYEKRRNWFDTSHVTAADVIRHLLEERQMSISALAREVGMSQGDLSNMLNGRRDWSKSAIVKLADHFQIDPALFLKPQV